MRTTTFGPIACFALLCLAFAPGAAATGTTEMMKTGIATGCHGAVNVIVDGTACTTDGCSGYTIILNSYFACQGGEGGAGCDGPTVILFGGGNCWGGDGGNGGDGGAGCTDLVAIIDSNGNCAGGDGGNGGGGGPGLPL